MAKKEKKHSESAKKERGAADKPLSEKENSKLWADFELAVVAAAYADKPSDSTDLWAEFYASTGLPEEQVRAADRAVNARFAGISNTGHLRSSEARAHLQRKLKPGQLAAASHDGSMEKVMASVFEKTLRQVKRNAIKYTIAMDAARPSGLTAADLAELYLFDPSSDAQQSYMRTLVHADPAKDATAEKAAALVARLSNAKELKVAFKDMKPEFAALVDSALLDIEQGKMEKEIAAKAPKPPKR